MNIFIPSLAQGNAGGTEYVVPALDLSDPV